MHTFCDFLPYFVYVDRALIYADCHVLFVFSAREQEYWYERMKFWVRSYPKQCPTCRRKRRQDRQVQAQLKMALDQLDTSDVDQLLHIADLYVRLGSLTEALTFLRRARKRAHSEEQKRLIEQRIETF